MNRLINKIFIKSNGHPRPWVKWLIFDDNLQVKDRWRRVVYLSSGTVREVFSEWYQLILENPSPKIDQNWINVRKKMIECGHINQCKSISIVTPKATIYVARMLQWNLLRWNIASSILEDMPIDFTDAVYIVICPQIYKRLPPRDRRIVYQMEQSVSTRWFTDEYYNILYNSIAILDYSEENIRYIEKIRPGLMNLFYVPIEPIPAVTVVCGDDAYCQTDLKYEIVFYGDSRNSRRKVFLKELKKHFEVKIIDDLYGVQLWKELKKAQVVVNIHYYENALLETTRISECLSLGLTVISEESLDQYAHKSLSDNVIFTPINDISAMVSAIRKELSGVVSDKKRIKFDENSTGTYLQDALASLGLAVEVK